MHTGPAETSIRLTAVRSSLTKGSILYVLIKKSDISFRFQFILLNEEIMVTCNYCKHDAKWVSPDESQQRTDRGETRVGVPLPTSLHNKVAII